VEDYALPHLVGDAIGLLDALDVQRPAVVAHDWGGVLGWALAATVPDRMDRLAAAMSNLYRATVDPAAFVGEAELAFPPVSDDRLLPTGWNGKRYDRIADPQHRWGKAILQHLDLDGSEVVFDAGCGTGRATEELFRRLPNGRVIALHASASMLDQARRLRSWTRRLSSSSLRPPVWGSIWPPSQPASDTP
jgi:pimeloyl-ACP methyl ester carboxylesterase